ncbi:hypothetical protein HHI36_009799 [Cryptolaemus montrouzieri]|uniref:Uncharacterized protein n=1 Tax=Cryptolaemus montrouzieri TaxID=559131 RepID=A0ABD2MGV8_9CUCU
MDRAIIPSSISKDLHESSFSKVDDKTYAAKLKQKSVLDTAKQLEERKQTMNSVHNPEGNKTRNPKNESVPKRNTFSSKKRRSDIIVGKASNDVEKGFKGRKRNAWLFVSRVKKDTKEEDIKKYLMDKLNCKDEEIGVET